MGAAGQGVRLLTRLFGVSALAGALTAGLVVPIAGFAGLGSEEVVDTLRSLPKQLNSQPAAVRTRILAADGSLIANLYDENRAPVGINHIAPVMRKAIISIED
ncbi:MAG: glycosyl transferase family 51, partial [Kribbellaceae bacterium]|nr:glycosyl transferase family 51 [Kribbellaceae bacterium]